MKANTNHPHGARGRNQDGPRHLTYDEASRLTPHLARVVVLKEIIIAKIQNQFDTAVGKNTLSLDRLGSCLGFQRPKAFYQTVDWRLGIDLVISHVAGMACVGVGYPSCRLGRSKIGWCTRHDSNVRPPDS